MLVGAEARGVASPHLVKSVSHGRLQKLAILWVLGGAALAGVTWACLQFGLSFATTAFIYLLVIALLSLMDSFMASALFSFVAISCLNYFFVEPRYTFRVNLAEDLATLIAFLLTAFVVTGLIRHMRKSAEQLRERALLLDLTQDAVLVCDASDVITSWNRGAEQLYGWSRQDAVGKARQELLQTVYPISLEVAKAKLLSTGRWEGEIAQTTRGGVKLDVECRWSLQLDRKGRLQGILETHHDVTERRQTKEILHRSRAAYLAEAQKLSHTGSFGWNVANGSATWSDETFRIFGYDRAVEPSIALVLERTHPEDVTMVRRAVARSADTGEGFDLEHRLRMSDGSLKHLHVVVHPSKDELGQLSFVGAVMDVTSRKSTEEALRSSEYRYQNMFRAMAASFWELDFAGATALVRPLLKSGVTDLRGYLAANPAFVREMMRATRVVEVNDQSAALFGMSRAATTLGSVEPFWPEESAHVYAEAYVRAIERRPNYSTECKLRRADGGLFDALFTVAYPPDIAHAKTIMVGVIDVSARKQSEAALRASEERYKNLFQSMAVSFFELDFSKANELLRDLRRSGVTDLRRHFKDNPEVIVEIMLATRVVDVNDQTVALFGRGNKEELLASTEKFWPEESRNDYAEAILSSVEHNLNFSVETKLRRLDGSLLDAQFTVWYSTTDKTAGLAGVLDITERIRAQESLRQVEADFAHAARVSMLGELTASIAHEVNQPLTAITTNAEAGLRWLDRPAPDVAEVRDLTKRIVSDARRAADVIARIRSMATRRGPEHALLSLDEIIADAVVFLRHELQSRHVVLTQHPTPGGPKVLADRIQIQQVIVNLAVNAMQAMATAECKEQKIVIRTAVSVTGEVNCTIEDSGPGIPPEVMPRLFESFFTTKDGGMGMGLPICRSIIEANGGRITADNRGIGNGARFSFSLPSATKLN